MLIRSGFDFNLFIGFALKEISLRQLLLLSSAMSEIVSEEEIVKFV